MIGGGDVADVGDQESRDVAPDVAPDAADLAEHLDVGASLARWSWSISRVKSSINASVLVMSAAPETRDGYGHEASTAVAGLDA